VVERSAERYRQAVSALEPVPDAKTALVLVGRGSYDPQATAEMFRFSGLRARETAFGEVMACFCAMARPSLSETLARVAALEFPRIVVQPHLLFCGELLAEVRSQVAARAASDCVHEWVVTQHLGAHRALAQAVIELATFCDSGYDQCQGPCKISV
jgi:sirohydrochlorin cobaltochelatase